MEYNQLSEQPAIDRNRLRTHGWTSYDFDLKTELALTKGLIALGEQLGTPVPLQPRGKVCDKLQPTEANLAKPNFLSRRFSLGEFPCHSDTAHWVTPCRFVILACVWPGAANRRTFLLDTNHLSLGKTQKDILHSAPFRIENGRNSFFGTILSKSRSFVRYDPCCMAALDSDGERALEVFSKERWPSHIEEIHWTEGKAIVIDNWRVLHGRGGSRGADRDRTLLRILIR